MIRRVVNGLILGVLALYLFGCVRTRVEYVRVPYREACAQADRVPTKRPFRSGFPGCPAGAVCHSRDDGDALADWLEDLERYLRLTRAACGSAGTP